MRVPVPFVMLVAALLLSGCAGQKSDTTSLRDQSVTIDPGQFHEVNLQIKTGDEINWEWHSDSALSFDLHAHNDQGGSDVYASTTGTNHAGKHVTTHNHVHSLMWVNNGNTPVAVQYDLWGDIYVKSIH